MALPFSRGTAAWRQVLGRDDGTTGIDDDFAVRSFENLGAWIMDRNMFGPVRGPWLDHEWKGRWGANPPYHVPVFVLTHLLGQGEPLLQGIDLRALG